jgi:hypothetical protein
MIAPFKPRDYLLILTLLLSACDRGRTPSNIRFPKNFKVQFPSDAKVIRDEYEGMGNDYAIYYTIKLTKPEMNRFIYKIKQSNNYDTSPPSNNDVSSNRLLIKQYKEGAWYKTSHNYRFFRHDGGTELNAFVDTVNSIAEFQEFGR